MVQFDESTDLLTLEQVASQYMPGSRFEVPRTGVVQVTVDSELKMPGKNDAVMSIDDVLEMINSDRLSLKDRQAMVQLATSELFFTASQAQALLSTDVVKRGSSIDRVRHVRRLLFRLVDPAMAAPFMKQNLTKRAMKRVQNQLGQAYRTLLGNPTGHYRLDLGVQQDRDLAQRLANLCADERDEALARYGKSFDTSQHQNGFSFRNELLDNEPFVVTPLFIGEVRLVCGSPCSSVAVLSHVGWWPDPVCAVTVAQEGNAGVRLRVHHPTHEARCATDGHDVPPHGREHPTGGTDRDDVNGDRQREPRGGVAGDRVAGGGRDAGHQVHEGREGRGRRTR